MDKGTRLELINFINESPIKVMYGALLMLFRKDNRKKLPKYADKKLSRTACEVLSENFDELTLEQKIYYRVDDLMEDN